jgi:hypothetical protein
MATPYPELGWQAIVTLVYTCQQPLAKVINIRQININKP